MLIILRRIGGNESGFTNDSHYQYSCRMAPIKQKTDAPPAPGKSAAAFLMDELIVDIAITGVIVAAVVLFLGEPLVDVLTGWIFIVLVSGSLIHLVYKYISRRAKANR